MTGTLVSALRALPAAAAAVLAAAAAAVTATTPAAAAAAKPPQRPRIHFCHVMHGLGNRLRALGSCMSFAKNTHRELLVIWERDSHIQAKYTDLFASPLAVMDSFNPTWPFTGREKYDASWSHFKFFNYMEMEGGGAKKGEWIVDEPSKHFYYKGAYIMEAPDELTSWDADNANLRSLEPVPAIAKRLNELETAHGLSVKSQLSGVHIRNRTLDKDIKNVDFVKEYGDSATATMEMWRRKSNYRTFLGEMQRIIAEEDPTAKFYVATDTYDVVAELEKALPGRVVSVPRTCDDRDGECVRMALLDMYCLSRTRSLLGSNWSSFTEAAERLGGIKAKLAGQDFAVTPAAAGGAAQPRAAHLVRVAHGRVYGGGDWGVQRGAAAPVCELRHHPQGRRARVCHVLGPRPRRGAVGVAPPRRPRDHLGGDCRRVGGGGGFCACGLCPAARRDGPRRRSVGAHAGGAAGARRGGHADGAAGRGGHAAPHRHALHVARDGGGGAAVCARPRGPRRRRGGGVDARGRPRGDGRGVVWHWQLRVFVARRGILARARHVVARARRGGGV